MNQTLNAAMGEAVLSRLAKLADFSATSKGIIAGQSVASALSELYGDHAGVVYNDVDLFKEAALPKYTTTCEGRVLDTLNYTMREVAMEYQHLNLVKSDVYQVHRTYREGLLNEVSCITQYGFFGSKKDSEVREFLSSFDLNCVQVGVDLLTRRIVWTPAFEYFWKTRQMEVENLRTPVHTAIRWMRKREELEGVYGNDETMMTLLAIATHRLKAPEMDAANSRTLFGNHYYEKFKDVANTVSPWFECVRTQCDKESFHDKNAEDIELFTLNPRASLSELALPEAVSEVHYDDLVLYQRAVTGRWKQHVGDRVQEVLTGDKKSLEYMYLVCEGVSMLGPERSRNVLAKHNNLVKNHNLGYHLRNATYDRAQELLSMYARLAHKHGQIFYGFYETAPYEFHKDGVFDTAPIAEIEAKIDAFVIQAIANSLAAKYPNKVLPAVAVNSTHTLKELTTQIELMAEGLRMHHCVGGYSSSVSRGDCRIVSIQAGKASESLSLELRRTGKFWYSHQLRGIANRDVTDEEDRMGTFAAVLFNVGFWLRFLPQEVVASICRYLVGNEVLLARMAEAMDRNLQRVKSRGGKSVSLSKRVKRWLFLQATGSETVWRIARNETNIRLQGRPTQSMYFSIFDVSWVFLLRELGTHYLSSFQAENKVLATASRQLSGGFDDIDDNVPF